MTNKSFATLGTLALLTAASAFGQQIVTADIPFQFSFANMDMPAGHYQVTSTHGMVRVADYAAQKNFVALSSNIGGGAQPTEPRLVFDKYGDKYFLAEVWPSSDTAYGVAVTKSRTERETASVAPLVARVTIPVRAGAGALASLR
jgi:hypothetical protein